MVKAVFYLTFCDIQVGERFVFRRKFFRNESGVVFPGSIEFQRILIADLVIFMSVV